jgi:hypothetical protein
MSSDFSAKGRSARDLIPVPDLPLNAIRSRSHAARARGRLQAIAACAAIAAGAIGAGSGLGEKVYDGVRVWLSGDKVAVAMTSFVMVRQPTAADLRDTIAGATFPVVFPAGIPADSRVAMLAASPPGHPSAIVVSYHTHPGGDGPTFVLLDPAVVDASGGGVRAASARFGAVYDWRTGGEIVLAAKRGLAPGDIGRIKAAMATSSPRQSLAAIDSMLATVAALGGPNRLELAERSAPRTGRSVLLDQAQVRSIPRVAQRGTPIRDGRAFRVTQVPYANGQMDYRKMRAVASGVVAVPPNGVRAIDAVLRSAGGGDCGCEVLFHQPSAATYWIWTIPMTGPPAAKKYAVDAKTLAVTAAT